MKFMDMFRFCGRCAKSALFAEIGEDGFCAKCRDEVIQKAEAEAAEHLRKKGRGGGAAARNQSPGLH